MSKGSWHLANVTLLPEQDLRAFELAVSRSGLTCRVYLLSPGGKQASSCWESSLVFYDNNTYTSSIKHRFTSEDSIVTMSAVNTNEYQTLINGLFRQQLLVDFCIALQSSSESSNAPKIEADV